MKYLFIMLFLAWFTVQTSISQTIDSTALEIRKIENSLNYKTGTIELESGNGKITVPEGFRFLDQAQSAYVLTDLWGNPADSTVLGLLVPTNHGVLDDKGWVFSISYSDIGYVEDEDAEEINYEELLEELKSGIKEENTERILAGYRTYDLIGWAAAPHYDKQNRTLHWAKELKFGDDSVNTLNYDLRVLGRKGIFTFSAISHMSEMNEVQPNISKIISCVKFNDGFKYSDFIPGTDNVAAWTLGSLVAGKLLAKVGFFALLLKFWKIIMITIVSGFGYLWKFIKGRRATSFAIGKSSNQSDQEV